MAAYRQGEFAIIGIGNEYRQDDGVGVFAARKLRELLPPGINVREESGEGARLMDAWDGFSCVILIDAVNTGGRPGEITPPMPSAWPKRSRRRVFSTVCPNNA
jgi:hydrogenase maturation protease